MRVYVPVGWPRLVDLATQGHLAGPIRASAVDPQWRAGAPEVDEEQWEFEAQEQAAAALPAGGGLVLALDVGPAQLGAGVPDDGWVVLAGSVERRDLGALLDRDLGWYGVQELEQLLAER